VRLPRYRSVMKWIGVALCALTLVGWKLTAETGVGIECWTTRTEWEVSIHGGVLELSRRYAHYWDTLSGWGYTWDITSSAPSRRYVPSLTRFSKGSRTDYWLYVPLYIPLALIAVPSAWLFYRDQRASCRARAGCCVGCGYDLSGVSTKCPECGRSVSAGGASGV
jgi:hypothetical protein